MVGVIPILILVAVSIDEPDNVDAGVTSVCISPDGSLVAAGSLDTVVRIWDVQTGKLVERLRGHRDSVYSVAFTPEGRGLVSGSLVRCPLLSSIACVNTGLLDSTCLYLPFGQWNGRF